MTNNPYAFWRAVLAGENPPISEGDLQPGFYRWRRKGRRSRPIAIWHSEPAGLTVKMGERAAPTDMHGEIWLSCCQHPISKEAYDKAVANGCVFAGEEVAIEGHNNPPADDADTIADQIEAVEKLIADLEINNESSADTAGNLTDRARQLAKHADEQRKAEKRPHDEAAKAVQAKWSPIIDRANAAAKAIKAKLTPWLREQEKRAKEAAATSETAKPAEPARVGGTLSGKRTSLRTTRSGTITDQDAFYQAMRDTPEVRECLQKLANKLARANAQTPGLHIAEERNAA